MYTTIRHIIALLLLSGTLFVGMGTPQTAQHDRLRIAHFRSNLVNDSLLDRISRNGYNYAAVVFIFRTSNDSVGDGDVYKNLRNDVCSLSIALATRNIRLIPFIPMSSKWALQWKILQIYENPRIGMNTITANDKLPPLLGTNPLCRFADRTDSVTMGCNSWAYEPEGVDKSIVDVFTAVRDGFTDAHTDYPLEYLHIHHDEPQFLNWLLMAGIGAPCGTAFPYQGNFARGEVSKADVAFIRALQDSGISTENAYQRLLADELYRRVTQAEEVFGPDLQLLFYAESFDDQSWGGVPWHVNLDDSTQIYMHNVITLPGLNESRKQKVHKKLIPIIWNYDGKKPNVSSVVDWLSRKKYNSNEVFTRFSSHGFRFLYVGALQHGNASFNQISEYATAAQQFQTHCLGYFAAAWDVEYDEKAPDAKWDILEYLPSVQFCKKGSTLLPPSSSSGVSFSVTAPSSSEIAVAFTLLRREKVEITIFTPDGTVNDPVLNRRVRTGTHTYHWKKPPGFYLVRLSRGKTDIIKAVTVKK